MDEKERRKFKRISTSVAVQVAMFDQNASDTKSSMAYSRNLSANGILVPSSEEFPVNSYVRLEFTLPGEKKPSAFFGRVVRVDRKGARGYELGVALLELPKGAVGRIDKYVSREAKKRGE